MVHAHTASRRAIGGRPIHSQLIQFPIVCFTLALLTDIAYWRTANLMWLNFSSWLLLAGVVLGVLAALAGGVEYLLRPSARLREPAWLYVTGSLLAFILALVNNLVHAGDGWTAVVPWGLALSAATVAVVLLTDWFTQARVVPYDRGSGL